MSIAVEDIKKLREATGAGIADVRQALEEANGDFDKATTIIKQKGLDRAESKSDREVNAGVVEVYSHAGRVGVLVEVLGFFL
jgi:elongation factor Ts